MHNCQIKKKNNNLSSSNKRFINDSVYEMTRGCCFWPFTRGWCINDSVFEMYKLLGANKNIGRIEEEQKKLK